MEHIHMILAVVFVVDIFVHIVWSVKSIKLDRRFAKVGNALAEQNALLKERNELLESIFAKELREAEKSHNAEE